MEKQEVQDANTRMRSKNESLQNENKDLKNQVSSLEMKAKQERDKWALERDELNKRILQVTTKETQYRHEIKSKDQTIEKLKDGFRQKMLEQAKKQ